jgi:hypothetical protein
VHENGKNIREWKVEKTRSFPLFENRQSALYCALAAMRASSQNSDSNNSDYNH